jgi:hypothetical protein
MSILSGIGQIPPVFGTGGGISAPSTITVTNVPMTASVILNLGSIVVPPNSVAVVMGVVKMDVCNEVASLEAGLATLPNIIDNTTFTAILSTGTNDNALSGGNLPISRIIYNPTSGSVTYFLNCNAIFSSGSLQASCSVSYFFISL